MNIPKYYLDQYFTITFQQIFKINRYNFLNTPSSIVELIKAYFKLLYSSTWFYIFDEWNYLLEKCGEMKDAKSLELSHYINKIIENLINKDSNLKVYKESLKKLTVLLGNIDYLDLILNNNLDDNIVNQLDDFLVSL